MHITNCLFIGIQAYIQDITLRCILITILLSAV